MKPRPKTIDEYLAALSSDKRAALERLRTIIRAVTPRAEESISYQLPAFPQRSLPSDDVRRLASRAAADTQSSACGDDRQQEARIEAAARMNRVCGGVDAIARIGVLERRAFVVM